MESRGAVEAEIVTRYKLVARIWPESNILGSCCVGRIPELRTVYRPHQWSEARIGGLLVFADAATALEFAGQDRQYNRYQVPLQLWRCSTEQPVACPKFGLALSLAPWFAEDVERLWQGKGAGPSMFVRGWPEGTEAWKRVRLDELLLET